MSMGTSLIASDSLLAIDVGAIHTRALLFDVVDGRYRFLASGTASTTAGEPFHDIGEGVRQALGKLSEITGRAIVDNNEHLILPEQADGSGVDKCVVTVSVGAPLKVVAVGLLDDVSTESAAQVASSTYARVVEKLSLIDRRNPAARLDAVLRTRPDVIIVAGGTEKGASHSLMSLLEAVGLACYLIPQEQRPEVLFAGNSALTAEVESSLSNLARLTIAPNVRPSLETEQLMPAQVHLAKIFRSVRLRQLPGLSELDSWSSGKVTPSALGIGRIIRFLSRAFNPTKGALGIDIGASATSVAAAFGGELSLGVYPDLGLGFGAAGIIAATNLEDITRWLTVDIPETDVRDYAFNKSLHPSSLPASEVELNIEQALARHAMRVAVQRLTHCFPNRLPGSGAELLPWVEPIIAGGSILTQAPTLEQALLMLLDGLQPTGITTIALDQNGLSSALGAAAEINSILPIQVLDSTTFLSLGTIISPVGAAKYGSPALRIKMTYEGGAEKNLEVKYGSLEVIPLPLGQPASLQIQPLNRFDVGMGSPGRGGTLTRVAGGALGVVIDARGRPLRLPAEVNRRREVMKKWLGALAG
jgi:uncharacterized protein (TIGR01319 family)